MIEVEIRLLDECNFNCMHCYADATVFRGDIASLPFYSEEYLRNFMEKLREFLLVLNAEYLKQWPLYLVVSLMGGEPLLIGIEKFRMVMNAVFKTFAQGGSDGFLLEKVTTSTNGILINEKWLSFFREERGRLSVAMAYDFGPVRFTSSSAERKWKEVYKVVRGEGIDVTVNVVLTRYIPEPEVFVNFLEKNGIDSVDLSPFLPVGRGRKFADVLKLSCSEITAYYKKFLDVLRGKPFSVRFDTFGNLPVYLEKFKSRLNTEVHLNGWGQCWNKVIVDLKGNVFLECSYPQALCNIFDPLAVYKMRVSEFFTGFLREKLYRNQCLECEFYNFCRGGCVALTCCEDSECRGLKTLLNYISESQTNTM